MSYGVGTWREDQLVTAGLEFTSSSPRKLIPSSLWDSEQKSTDDQSQSQSQSHHRLLGHDHGQNQAQDQPHWLASSGSAKALGTPLKYIGDSAGSSSPSHGDPHTGPLYFETFDTHSVRNIGYYVSERAEGRHTFNQSLWRLPQKGRGVLLFESNATCDIILAIASQPFVHDPMYEIVLGGWTNTRLLPDYYCNHNYYYN